MHALLAASTRKKSVTLSCTGYIALARVLEALSNKRLMSSGELCEVALPEHAFEILELVWFERLQMSH